NRWCSTTSSPRTNRERSRLPRKASWKCCETCTTPAGWWRRSWGRGSEAPTLETTTARNSSVPMEHQDAIVRLLTEIRDNQQEELAWRKRAVRLQRLALARQRKALLLVCAGLVLAGFGVALLLLVVPLLR